MIAKDSASNSINTKEERNSRIKAKIQSSANRLSSNNKDNYKSEGSSSKIDHYTQKSDINDTPSANDKNDNSTEIKKYLLNMSSNQSLNINKSELELISSDDYKNTGKLEIEDIQNSSGSPPKIEIWSEEVSFDKEMNGYKDLFNPQISQKNSKVSKLIEQEKTRRMKEVKNKKKLKSQQNYKGIQMKLENHFNKPIFTKTRKESVDFNIEEIKSTTISSQLRKKLANKDKLVQDNGIVSFCVIDPQAKLHHKSRNSSSVANGVRTQPTSACGTTAHMPHMSIISNVENNAVGVEGSKINISNLLSFAKADSGTEEFKQFEHTNSVGKIPICSPQQHIAKYSLWDLSKDAKPRSLGRKKGKSSVKVSSNLKEITSQTKSLFKEFSLRGSQTTRNKIIKSKAFRKCFIN